MRNASLKLINPLGLHARAAAKLVDVTKAFASDVTLAKADKAVDAKSIMAVLMLGAPVGTELELSVEGEDEDQAIEAIQALVEAGFYELEDPE